MYQKIITTTMESKPFVLKSLGSVSEDQKNVARLIKNELLKHLDSEYKNFYKEICEEFKSDIFEHVGTIRKETDWIAFIKWLREFGRVKPFVIDNSKTINEGVKKLQKAEFAGVTIQKNIMEIMTVSVGRIKMIQIWKTAMK